MKPGSCAEPGTLSGVIDATPYPLASTDGEDHDHLCNAVFARLVGLPASGILGREDTEIGPAGTAFEIPLGEAKPRIPAPDGTPSSYRDHTDAR